MKTKEIKLGVLGMSEGNGHPYSWSAIFNGYDMEYMQDCPFPVIPEYLAQQSFPTDAIKGARVTHIWTQDVAISKHVAKASRIDHICEQPEDMIGQIDGLLLARDDAENHYEMALPFLKARLPIFIDKPLAYDRKTAAQIWKAQEYPDQIFTCSSLRFAKEFQLSQKDRDKLGPIRFVSATVPKSWIKYAIHIIEPTLALIPNRGSLQELVVVKSDDLYTVSVKWENRIIGQFTTMGANSAALKIQLYGQKGNRELVFKDTFYAFKKSLEYFIGVLRGIESNIPRDFTEEVIEIIEKGNV